MEYTNSPLTDYTKLSPNHSGQRTHSIDRITPHCYVGQAGVESMSGWLCSPQAQASANYGITFDGKVVLLVEEKNRSWCSSNAANDQRAITIECASEVTDPYAIYPVVYNKLIDLMADICKRNGKTKLLWFADREKTLNYKPKDNEMVITVHRWFANKACPGDYIYNRLGKIADAVNEKLGTTVIQPEKVEIKWYRVRKSWEDERSQIGAYEKLNNAKKNCPDGYNVYDNLGKVVYTPENKAPKGVPTSKIDFIEKVGAIAKELYKETQILPSVVIAQCCLETGYGLGADATELMASNNLLGMKASLLNSTWSKYSVWNGESFNKITPEYVTGKKRYITDTFRIYTDYANCIKDYEMFLLHVKSGNNYKYRKIIGMTDPKAVITAIITGGYATDPSYISKVMDIIAGNNLRQYDEDAGVDVSVIVPEVKEPVVYYKIQTGAYTRKVNADKQVAKLKEKGIDAIVVPIDNVFKVQAGAYTDKYNAEKKLKLVHAAGFADAFITT